MARLSDGMVKEVEVQKTPAFHHPCLVTPEQLSSLVALYKIAGKDSDWPEPGHVLIPTAMDTGSSGWPCILGAHASNHRARSCD